MKDVSGSEVWEARAEAEVRGLLHLGTEGGVTEEGSAETALLRGCLEGEGQ